MLGVFIYTQRQDIKFEVKMFTFTTEQREQFQKFYLNPRAEMNDEEKKQTREMNRILRDAEFDITGTEIRIMGKHILCRSDSRPFLCTPIKLVRSNVSLYPELRQLF